MTTWVLVILLYVGDGRVADPPVEREFPTQALCEQERDHLRKQAIPAGVSGRVVVACEPRQKG